MQLQCLDKNSISEFQLSLRCLVWWLRARISELGGVAQMLLHSLPAMEPWSSYLTSLCLCVTERKFVCPAHSEAKQT